jgi:hypothetical protein
MEYYHKSFSTKCSCGEMHFMRGEVQKGTRKRRREAGVLSDYLTLILMVTVFQLEALYLSLPADMTLILTL